MKINTAWPNKAQLTLLKAALLPPNQAEAYWLQFIDSYDLQKLDHGCNQVLPMVFINLKGRIKKDINEKTCRSSYKYAWANNHLLMHDAKALLILLKKNNLDVCLLKGAAFIGHYFPDYGMRILGDVDLLIPPQSMNTLVNTLESNQYKPKYNQGDSQSLNLIKEFHAKSFVNARGSDFDIHQYLSPFLVDANFSKRLWQNKKAIDLFGEKNLAYVLSPTYQLIHTVLHGLQYAPVSSVRWVVDASNLLTYHANDIAWDELIDACSTHHLNLPMSQALNYLYSEIEAPIPEHIISYFKNLKITSKDNNYYINSSNLGFQYTLGRVKKSWEHYKLYTSDNKKKLSTVGFYNFLMIYLEVKSPWKLIPYIISKSAAVVTRATRRLLYKTFQCKRQNDE